jgi:radical SAM superfamily enzyme YgiQ (UPF0313 family)
MARIAFIQQLFFEYLGTEYLSAALKKNYHTVEVFIESNNKSIKFINNIKRFTPDVFAFSVITGQHEWALETAELLGTIFPNVLRIFGGPHPTFFPDIINHSAVDAICIGEGDEAICNFANARASGTLHNPIANLHIKHSDTILRGEVRHLVEDLDSLPFPDRTIYYDKYPGLRSSRTPFLTGRGCPFNCSYCFNHSLKSLYHGKGVYVRRRTPENIISEIEQVHNRYRCKTIYFQDDTFISDESWTISLLKLYHSRISLPFICLATAEKLNSTIVDQLARNGCSRIFFGVESGNETLRQTVLKKHLSDRQIIDGAAQLRKHHIPFRTYNMVGLPGESVSQALQTVSLNQKIRTPYPWCSLYTPLPGTQLATYAEKQSNISTTEWTTSFFSDRGITTPSMRKMANLQKLFFWIVKLHLPLWIVRLLITLPKNSLYHLLFLMSYGWCYLRSERSGIPETVEIGRRNLSVLFSRRRDHTITKKSAQC